MLIIIFEKSMAYVMNTQINQGGTFGVLNVGIQTPTRSMCLRCTIIRGYVVNIQKFNASGKLLSMNISKC